MASHIIRALLVTLTLCWSLTVQATASVPALTGHVIDQTSTLSAQQQRTLEHTLQSYVEQKGRHFVVLVIPTPAPESIEHYAMRVSDQWQLGYNNLANGVLLVVAWDSLSAHIEVGYGLQNKLNNAMRERIAIEIMAPYFRQGDFYGGIMTGVDQLIRVMDGNSLSTPDNALGFQPFFPIIIVVAWLIGSGLRSVMGRFPCAIATGGITAFLVWFFVGTLPVAMITGLLAMLLTLLRNKSGPVLLVGAGQAGGNFRTMGFGGGGASGRW